MTILGQMATDPTLGSCTFAMAAPMHVDGTGHPANDRLGLYRALKSHVHALGLSWDSEGGNNGHNAPFAWRSA